MNALITVGELKTEQEHFLNAIIESRGDNLPMNVSSTLDTILVTSTKAKAYRAFVDSMKKIPEAQEAVDKALESGQLSSIAHLYAVKHLGELTKEMKPEYPVDHTGGRNSKAGPAQRFKGGVNGHSYGDAERIARNPEILDRVVENAKERGEIPTKTAVLNTIKVEEMRKRDKERVKKNHDRIENGRDKSVSEYYEAIKGFTAALNFAIIAAERGKFDPAGKNFLTKKNDSIRELLIKLEESI